MAAPLGRRTFGLRKEARGDLCRADILDMAKAGGAHFHAKRSGIEIALKPFADRGHPLRRAPGARRGRPVRSTPPD